jgi:hypothetical protein
LLFGPHAMSQKKKILKAYKKHSLKIICTKKKNRSYDSSQYVNICNELNLHTLQVRRQINDVTFFKKVLVGHVTIPEILQDINIHVPARALRH